MVDISRFLVYRFPPPWLLLVTFSWKELCSLSRKTSSPGFGWMFFWCHLTCFFTSYISCNLIIGSTVCFGSFYLTYLSCTYHMQRSCWLDLRSTTKKLGCCLGFYVIFHTDSHAHKNGGMSDLFSKEKKAIWMRSVWTCLKYIEEKVKIYKSNNWYFKVWVCQEMRWRGIFHILLCSPLSCLNSGKQMYFF